MANNKNIMSDPYDETRKIYPVTYEECVIGDMHAGINNIKNKLKDNYYDKNAFADAFNIDVSGQQVPELLYLAIHPEPWEANNIPNIPEFDGWVCHCLSEELNGMERITKTMLLFKKTAEIESQGLLLKKGSMGMDKLCFPGPTNVARASGDKKYSEENISVSTGWELRSQNTYTEMEVDSFSRFYNGNVKVFYRDTNTIEFNGVPIKPLKTNSLTVPISNIVDTDKENIDGKMSIVMNGFNDRIEGLKVGSNDGTGVFVDSLTTSKESRYQTIKFFSNIVNGIGKSFMNLTMKELKLMDWNIPLTAILFPSHIYPTQYNPEYTRFSVDGFVYTIIGSFVNGDMSIPVQLGRGYAANNIPDIFDRNYTIEKLDRLIYGKTIQNLEFNMPNNAILISCMAKVLHYNLTCFEYAVAEEYSYE